MSNGSTNFFNKPSQNNKINNIFFGTSNIPIFNQKPNSVPDQNPRYTNLHHDYLPPINHNSKSYENNQSFSEKVNGYLYCKPSNNRLTYPSITEKLPEDSQKSYKSVQAETKNNSKYIFNGNDYDREYIQLKIKSKAKKLAKEMTRNQIKNVMKEQGFTQQLIEMKELTYLLKRHLKDSSKAPNLHDQLHNSLIKVRDDLHNRMKKHNIKVNRDMHVLRNEITKLNNPELNFYMQNFFPKSEYMDEDENDDDNRKSYYDLFKRKHLEIPTIRKYNSQSSLFTRNNYHMRNYDNESDEEKSIDIDEFDYSYALDYRKRYYKEQQILEQAVIERLDLYKKQPLRTDLITKFRVRVYYLIAARRLLNIQYTTYSHFKSESVHFFITNYEDMDIMLKKSIYNAISPVFMEILMDKHLDIDLSHDRPDSIEVFRRLSEILNSLVNSFNASLFNTISKAMLSYLSLFVTNYSYVPRDFYTTFELIRIQMTSSGELIELEKEKQVMILGFYIFLKILIKDIFLEMIFNREYIKNIDMRTKLNIKMIISVLYRGLIAEFQKCEPVRNFKAIEKEENALNYWLFYIKSKRLYVGETSKRIRLSKENDLIKQKEFENKNVRYFNERHEYSKWQSEKEKKIKIIQANKYNDIHRNIILNEGESIKQDNKLNTDEEDEEDGEDEEDEDKEKVKQKTKLVKSMSVNAIIQENEVKNTKKKIKKRKITKEEVKTDVKEELKDNVKQEEEKAKSKRKKFSNLDGECQEQEIASFQNIGIKKKRKTDKSKQIEIATKKKPPSIEINIVASPNPPKKKRKVKVNVQEGEKEKDIKKDIKEKDKVFYQNMPLSLKKNNANMDHRASSVIHINNISKVKVLEKKFEPPPIIINKSSKAILSKSLLPVFPPEFRIDEIKTMQYIREHLPQYEDDLKLNEFDFIYSRAYDDRSLEIYNILKEEKLFDPIFPLLFFLDTLHDKMIRNFLTESF